MKKKRTIIIKDPRLRKIRNNLRSLILEAIKSIQHRLLDEIEVIENTNGYFNFDNADLIERNKELGTQKQLLDRQVNASIIFCPVCFKSDRDMTYNPVRETWFCTECYTKLQRGFTEEGNPEEFP